MIVIRISVHVEHCPPTPLLRVCSTVISYKLVLFKSCLIDIATSYPMVNVGITYFYQWSISVVNFQWITIKNILTGYIYLPKIHHCSYQALQM